MNGAVLNLSGESERGEVNLVAARLAIPREDGDSGLRRAFGHCGENLYRFILLRVGGDRHTADDLLQQTCYEAARHRRTPSGDDAAQAWLFGIAKNLIRKHFRRVRREVRFRREGVAENANPSSCESGTNEPEAIEQSEAAPQLLMAIAALTDADQQLILGSYFEGRSHEELAREIGVSVRAIEGRLYRARIALRKALRARLGEDGL